MTAGTLATLLDYCGNRVNDGISSVKAVYSAHASDTTGGILWIPESLDASLTCLVLPAGGDVAAGNSEAFGMNVDLHFWINAAVIGQAWQAAVQCVDSCRSLFRRDVTAGGSVDWVLMRGFLPPAPVEANGVVYLVQTVNLRGLSMHFSSDYTTAT